MAVDPRSEYQKAVDRLIAAGPEAFKRIEDVLIRRQDELDVLWLEAQDSPFDEGRVRGLHRGTTELKKLVTDLRNARAVFEQQVVDANKQPGEGDGNGTAY